MICEMYVSCIILSRKVWIPYRRTSPAEMGCNWPVCHSQGERGNSCVQGKGSHSVNTKQRITSSFWTWSKFLASCSTKSELMVGMRRCIAETPGPKVVPDRIHFRNPKRRWIQQVERWPAKYRQRQSFVFVLVSIPKTKSFHLTLTK